jgi:hypothetical protein
MVIIYTNLLIVVLSFTPPPKSVTALVPESGSRPRPRNSNRGKNHPSPGPDKSPNPTGSPRELRHCRSISTNRSVENKSKFQTCKI